MTTIKTKRTSEGNYVELLSDGGVRPSVGKSDWQRVDAMTDEEVTAAALADPDAQPLTDETAKTRKRLSPARAIRRALRLTQEEFATRYHIPVGTLRDWEQGRAEPDQPARAYLRAIAGDPEAVKRALELHP